MKIYLLRHGQTDWNCIWKMQGATDIPLNETGIRQAHEAAERMKDEHYDAIYSSPLVRARVTAEIISEKLGMNFTVDERLKEMCFGVLEGTTPDYSEINPNRKRFFDEPANYVPDPTAESFDDVGRRCESFLDELKKTGYDRVLIVCHGALTKSMLRVIYHKSVSEYWDTPPQPNCTAIEVDLDAVDNK